MELYIDFCADKSKGNYQEKSRLTILSAKLVPEKQQTR
jgi:hypothetical protein